MTIGVLGVGAMGKLIALDLFEKYKGRIVLFERKPKKIQKWLDGISAGKNISVQKADVSDIKSMVRAFRKIEVIIHAVHHEFNLNVMNACLKSKTHYIDLGGLYHYTKKQLKLNRQFKKANLTAVLGVGAAPGITNILAKYASRFVDYVDDVEIRIGFKDFSTYKQESPLSSSYSIQTVMEEFSWKPAVFINGRIRFVEPMSGREKYRFTEPIGVQKPQYTIHSELATLPHTLNAKNVSFKIAFDDDFVNKMKILSKLGFLADEKVSVAGEELSIKSVVPKILKKLPIEIPDKIRQYEIIRVVVKGKKSGKHKRVVADAHIEGIGETVDKDTGVPPSIIAQMIVSNKIGKRGVFPPESIVPETEFFAELAKRKIYIYCNGKKIT